MKHVGIFERVFPRTASTMAVVLNPPALASPWTSGQLSRVVVSELAGLRPDVITRASLMRIPAVNRGRGLVCGTLARHPLSLWQDTLPEATRLAPAQWMTSTATGQAPALRALWTLDDMAFGGLAVWAVQRVDSNIVDAIRVPPERWTIHGNSSIAVDGDVASAEEILIFEGPQEGLVTLAEDSARGSRDLSNAWRQRVAAPVPMVTVRQTDMNVHLTDDEIDSLIKDVEAARSKSGTVFVPEGFEIDAPGAATAPDLYVAGRNAERLDWANHWHLPASMLDGSTSTASLTYSTAEGKRSEFLDYTLAYWAMPYEARLSQDDVTPEGTFVRVDLSALATPTQPGTNPATED